MADAVSRQIDVMFQGVAHGICAHQVGDVLVDVGPESAHHTLLDALGDDVPRALLLTHIHFDHAGAAGALVRRWPHLEVWVHERGAPPPRQPRAARLERATAVRRRLRPAVGRGRPDPGAATCASWPAARRSATGAVAYTPGHASHHVAYLDQRTGAAFTGDVAGARIGGGPLIPPTPPPDIDLELWAQSIDTIAAWEPAALAITHYGTFTDVAEQLDSLRQGLDHWGQRARELTDEAYQAEVRATWAEDAETAAYDAVVPAPTLWPGLQRYWEKRVPSET